MNPFNNGCYRKYDGFNTHLDFPRKVKVFGIYVKIIVSTLCNKQGV